MLLGHTLLEHNCSWVLIMFPFRAITCYTDGEDPEKSPGTFYKAQNFWNIYVRTISLIEN